MSSRPSLKLQIGNLPALSRFAGIPRGVRRAGGVMIMVAIGLLSTGCTPYGMALGVGAKAVTMASEERGFGQAVEDGRIQVQLNGDLFALSEDVFESVNLTVRNGRVLMTGSVPTAQDRVNAIRTAWQVDGVKEVINELKVSTESDAVGFGRDVWLINKLETILLFDSEVDSINYTIDVDDGVLYIMGTAQSEQERNRVIAHARGLEHVRRIVDYSRVKKGAGQ